MTSNKVYCLDFFQDEDKMITQHKLMRLDETVHRIRRGLWARNNLHERQILELHDELEFLKKMICRTNTNND